MKYTFDHIIKILRERHKGDHDFKIPFFKKEKRKKRKMKNKPVHEYTDKRYSVRHKIQQDKRRRARKVATKMLGSKLLHQYARSHATISYRN